MGFWGRVTLVCAAVILCARASAGTTQAEDLRKDIDDLRRQLNGPTSTDTIRSVDALGDVHGVCKDEKVTTRCGKLEVGGLLQLWDVHYAQDRQDVFGTTGAQLIDNSGRRVRRSEIKFTIDILPSRFQGSLCQSAGCFDKLCVVHHNQSLQRSVRSLTANRATLPGGRSKDLHRSWRRTALPESVKAPPVKTVAFVLFIELSVAADHCHGFPNARRLVRLHARPTNFFHQQPAASQSGVSNHLAVHAEA